MNLSYMSFLFPKYTAQQLIDTAAKYGYDGLEWRAEAGHGHGVELESSDAQLADIRARTAEAGLETACLATSIKFTDPDPAARAAMVERTRRFLELAVKIGAPRIRFFADPIPNTGRGARANAYAYQSESIAEACEYAAEAGVRLCLETHSVFRAVDLGEVLFRTAYPEALWVNWHLAHCLNHGEGVDEAYRHVKGRVDHAHFSFYGQPDRHGNPTSIEPHVERQAELLAIEGFTGHFSLEMMPGDRAKAEELVAEHVRRFRAMCQRLGID